MVLFCGVSKKRAVGLWNCRLGHTNIPVARDMIAAGKYDMNNSSEKKQVCETCVETKSTKVAYKGESC